MAETPVSPSDLTARLNAAQERTHGPVRTLTVPAGFAKAFLVAQSQTVRIETPSGDQTAALFACRADDSSEWLSPPHTWSRTHCLRPRAGDELLSTARQPLLLFLEDGAGGVHDMLLPACDPVSYEQPGADDEHRSCAVNLREALHELGVRAGCVPSPVNFFTSTSVQEDGAVAHTAAGVPAGAFVLLEALTDLVCVISSCPAGAGPEWSSSAAPGPTRLLVQIA